VNRQARGENAVATYPRERRGHLPERTLSSHIRQQLDDLSLVFG
jgi:hypothetical protein